MGMGMESGQVPAGTGYDGAIAVIGMDFRFPGASTAEAFWNNLSRGVESIRFFREDELKVAGVEASEFAKPGYVKACGYLEDIELFDSAFFGFSAMEANVMDPQHRLFLESSWRALENAGYGGAAGRIGVFGAAAVSEYLLHNLLANRKIAEDVGEYQLSIANLKDYLATRVSYKLGLEGPSVNINTACSSSLVAVHYACQGLLDFHCDMALAGAVGLRVPHVRGYRHQEGHILSRDGHSRTFDREASGTVPGSGLGVVVLKRMDEAVADGDSILAVIRGSAVNNDGNGKVGFTAPSLDGQAKVILEALAAAGLGSADIDYVEAHGTGTVIGDPIEVAALAKAFRSSNGHAGACWLGSVKTNLGHLDTAAGMAGLIKAVLSLQHGAIPPSLHFREPNPEIDFAASPFRVNCELRPWPRRRGGPPRRAGVSSFGIGGTNAHLVVEEAPVPDGARPARSFHVYPVSARTEAALDRSVAALSAHFREHVGLDTADAAYTLQVGRKDFAFRRIAVLESGAGSVPDWREPGYYGHCRRENPRVAFLFPGQGAQYAGMAAEFYAEEPEFRSHLDDCAALAERFLGLDLKALLHPVAADSASEELLGRTCHAQPALFAVEYSLARTLMGWGIRPDALLGHSIGEWVAACLSGLFTLEEAMRLVCARGRLMQSMAPGAMLAAGLSLPELEALMPSGLEVASINSPSSCVASGPVESIALLEGRLEEKGVFHARLRTSHAFHSRSMDAASEAFLSEFTGIRFGEPRIPVLSNLTGTWVKAGEASQAGYWARQLRMPVQFAANVRELLRDPDTILLEVGPGRSLATLIGQFPGVRDRAVLSCLGGKPGKGEERKRICEALGKLWLFGVRVDWKRYHAGWSRRRVPLPGYSFDRTRHWVEPEPAQAVAPPGMGGKRAPEDWCYVSAWKRRPLSTGRASSAPVPGSGPAWLILLDSCGFGRRMAERLSSQGHLVTVAGPCQDGWGLPLGNGMPGFIVDCRMLDAARATRPPECAPLSRSAFYGLLDTAKSLGKSEGAATFTWAIVTEGVFDVIGTETLMPGGALSHGPAKVAPQEFPHVSCATLDLVLPDPASLEENQLMDALAGEVMRGLPDPVVAFRNGIRWIQAFERVPLRESGDLAPIRRGGTYLVTGGTGRIGLLLAERLFRRWEARLILVGRSLLPDEKDWASLRAAGSPDQVTAARVASLKRLRDMGAELLVLSAEVADPAAMAEVMEAGEKRFGRIDGVFHAAGVAREALLDEIRDEDCESEFRSKVDGALALHSLLVERKPDFVLTFSSLSSVLGGMGFTAYAAANAFLDALGQKYARDPGVRWLSVAWDSWKLAESPTPAPGPGRSIDEFGADPSELLAVLDRILASELAGGIVVSTGDLALRMGQWIGKRESPPPTAQAQEPVAAHPRPVLPTPYEPARSEAEQVLAGIWQDLLGVAPIGVHDEFFELGGHSLLATQLVSRIRDAFGTQLSIRVFFEGATVAQIAERIRGPYPGDAIASPAANEFEEGEL